MMFEQGRKTLYMNNDFVNIGYPIQEIKARNNETFFNPLHKQTMKINKQIYSLKKLDNLLILGLQNAIGIVNCNKF